MCHNRYIEYTLMYISYKCIGYVEYNEYSFMYFITKTSLFGLCFLIIIFVD